jgi:glycosyltransferase involved in cell wall biosynthesis
MHAPLFTLAKIAESLPPTRVLHSVSTGYAGFLGALVQRRLACPFILTEHGIYTKERRIDLAHADWIRDTHQDVGAGLDESVSHIRSLWIRFFEGLGRMAYATAEPIVSLYEGNRERQISDGADPARTRVVPNGIDLERFEALAAARTEAIPPVIGLIGRVVPIKDIRTFIRSLRIVCSKRPEVEGWIVGPEDEDAAYARECSDLVTSLGLQKHVKFLGFRRPEEVLPRLGLVMLTSISEALPLVVLESFAAGVPVVSTDVGACRELIEGRDAGDRALGRAGVVTPIANPEATARAALALLSQPEAWRSAQRAGQERVRRYYTRAQMFASYQAIYQQALEASRGRDRVRAS